MCRRGKDVSVWREVVVEKRKMRRMEVMVVVVVEPMLQLDLH